MLMRVHSQQIGTQLGSLDLKIQMLGCLDLDEEVNIE